MIKIWSIKTASCSQMLKTSNMAARRRFYIRKKPFIQNEHILVL